MSDEEIRELLDLGVREPDSDGLSAEQLWTAGRRQRNRGRAWLGGLGAAAAAASILGIVWAQGLAGGDAAPPPADTTPGPTVEVESGARGEPFFARFDRSDADPSQPLSGTSVAATLEDLQGTWRGAYGERLVVEEDQVILAITNCESVRSSGTVSADGQLSASEWSFSTADGPDCEQPDPAMTNWMSALMQSPQISLDGETLIVSGLDGTTDEPRVQVSLTLGQIDETGFNWADVPTATDVTPITLGNDFALSLSGGDDRTLGSINLVMLDEQPGIAAAAQNPDIEVIGYPGTCPQVMESSLRSDGVLLAGPPSPMPACTDGSAAILPPSEPSPAAVALLRSGPTVGFEGDTLVISGMIPEALLAEPAPPIDGTTPTSGPEVGETATGTISIPNVIGSSTVVVMSEGGWDPSGVLTPLRHEEAVGRHWLPVNTQAVPPIVGDDVGGERGLTFDGTNWRVRECGIDVTVPGRLEDSVLVATGDPVVVPDPDPGAACVFPGLMPDEWASVLTSRPRLSTDGSILVLVGRTDDGPLEPVGMALLGDGVSDPSGGPTRAVTAEELAAGLTELPRDVAIEDIGVSDHLDLQPGHSTTLTLQDGMVALDVGCGELLRGPAWFSQVGHEDERWQLTAALPQEPDCGADTGRAAAGEAELWRQMLAQGAFVHHFGDYVIVDAMVDAVWAGAGSS